MLPKSNLDRLITFLGITGFILAIVLSQRVFPSAAVDLTLPRQAIYQQAEAYVQNHSLPTTANYESAQSFRRDRIASFYLQQTMGIAATNQQIQAENLPIYYWQVRWFQPSEQEEARLSLSPTGDVIGYSHIVPESAPGARLDIDAAQTIAETYLQRDRGWNLDDWELIDTATTQQPERTDHVFDWQRRGTDFGDAELRLQVTIRGDQVGDYDYWLKVPEDFSRQFSEKRNLALFIDRITTFILQYGTIAAAFVFYLIAIARNQVNWRSGLRPALIVLGVALLAGLNGSLLAKGYYRTTENYSIFWLEEAYNLISYVLFTAVPVYFLWIGGQQIYQRLRPRQDMFLPRSPNRLKVFTQAYWRGLMLGGMSLGYLMLFYLLATRVFQSWAPMTVNYSDLFATPFPFMAPLRTGIVPAITEELEARLVGISLILLVTRNRWLALIIPAGLWAGAHLHYVAEPFYLRGIELWVPGIVNGLFFLRFGLLTTIVGHCVHNALLGAGALIRTQDAYLTGSGVLVVALLLMPLLPGLWQSWRGSQQLSSSLGIVSILPEDADSLKSLPIEPAVWQAAITNPEYFAIVCLKSATTIEGVAIAQLTSAEAATVQTVFVNPQYRRCYYGSQLLEALQNRLQQRGVTSLQADVKDADSGLQRFWANQNWQAIAHTFQANIATTTPPEASTQRHLQFPKWRRLRT